METEGFFQFRNHHKWLNQLFSFHLNISMLWVYGHYTSLIFQYGDRLYTSESWKIERVKEIFVTVLFYESRVYIPHVMTCPGNWILRFTGYSVA